MDSQPCYAQICNIPTSPVFTARMKSLTEPLVWLETIR